MRCVCIVFIFSLISYNGLCQEKDSTRTSKKPNKLIKFIRDKITRNSTDSSREFIMANETQFLPYNGKSIRNIIIEEFEFAKPFDDTAKVRTNFGKKLVNSLLTTTKEKVIRNNLFLKEKTAFNASLAADNERYLRTLNYISDARIVVDTIAGEPDSIDVIVITKNFFSIIAEVNSISKDRFKSKFGDANFMGTAQKIQVTTLLEKKRDPYFGYEILYKKNTISNTFINVIMGYSQIAPNLNDQTPDEHTWHVEVERPLVSQYLHATGAVRFAQSETRNDYAKPDSLFYDYRSNAFDAWIGYNLGASKVQFQEAKQLRRFISLRYLRNKFKQLPYQVGNKFIFRFNDREAVLTQLTFFKQSFFKTNYLFGFGITEDVPYGYNIALTGGWYKQSSLDRWYSGIDANRYVVTRKGDMLQYFLRAGTFLNKGDLEDATVLAGGSAYSRISSLKRLKMRQYLRVSYTKQFNRIGLDPLNINNVFGLPYIPGDSASGDQRMSMHTETIFFLKRKLLGFKFSPFVSGDITYLTTKEKSNANSGLYYGVGGGIRTRNENIVFGTVELRFMYFPRQSLQYNEFKFTVLTNLRFRSNFNYIKAPDIIEVNSDVSNNIY